MRKIFTIVTLFLWGIVYHIELRESGEAHADKQDKYKVISKDKHTNSLNNRPVIL